MREEASFRMIFEKFRVSKRKLVIDDPKLPKKGVSSHQEEVEAPVEFVSTVEQRYFFLSKNITSKLFRQWKYCF